MARLIDFSPSDRQRLSRSVWAARRERGWTDLAKWADVTGLSLPTLRKLDHARPVSRETLVTVSLALGWPELRAEQILADRHASAGVADASNDELAAEIARRLRGSELLEPGRPLRVAEVRELDHFLERLAAYRDEAASELLLAIIDRMANEIRALLASPPGDEQDD